jgi:hypothetical protein
VNSTRSARAAQRMRVRVSDRLSKST